MYPNGTEKWCFYLPPSDPPLDLPPEEKEEWIEQKRGAGFATHAPLIEEDIIYFGVTFHPHETPEDADIGVYAVHTDGSMKWFFPTEKDVTSSPNIGKDGSIYVAATTTFYAINPDGTLKWTYNLEKGVSWSSPSVADDGTIYVVGETLLSLYPDGRLKWSYQDDSYEGGLKGFASHPTIDSDGCIYFGAGERLYAINHDGSEKWVIDLAWTESSLAIGEDNTMYIGTGDRGFIALNKEDGLIKWTFPLETSCDSSPAIGVDGTIYFGSDDGYFYALHADGTVQWKLDVGHSNLAEVDTSPAIGRDQTLYFGHAGGPGDVDGLWFYAIHDFKG